MMRGKEAENKKCPKCDKGKILEWCSDLGVPYTEEELPKVLDPNIVYMHEYTWFQCDKCNWCWNNEGEGWYRKELKEKDIKIEPSTHFHEKNHNWKWMPISKREAEENKDKFCFM
jgi:hypothetical protein